VSYFGLDDLSNSSPDWVALRNCEAKNLNIEFSLRTHCFMLPISRRQNASFSQRTTRAHLEQSALIASRSLVFFEDDRAPFLPLAIISEVQYS
jgi:hypothetical protein